MTMLSDTQSIPALRETEFPITAEWTYLNHAYESPNPARAIAAIADKVAQAQRPYLAFPQHDHALDEIKHRLSGMTGYAPGQFALLTNVGDATSTIANGLRLQSGDEIIMVEREFPSFVFPWRVQERRGARCIFVSKDGVATNLDRIEAAITDRTRVIAISHVDFQSGFKNDIAALGKLARDRGIYLFLDVSQSLGARPFDYASAGVAGIVGVGFKWLMGLHGLSLLGIADWAQDAIEPTIAGRNGMTDAWMDGDLELNWLPDARRYQSGNLNWLAVWGLALAELARGLRIRQCRIQRHAHAQSSRLRIARAKCRDHERSPPAPCVDDRHLQDGIAGTNGCFRSSRCREPHFHDLSRWLGSIRRPLLERRVRYRSSTRLHRTFCPE